MSGVGVGEQNEIAEPEIFPNDVGARHARDHSNPQPERLWRCLGVILVTASQHRQARLTESKDRKEQNPHTKCKIWFPPFWLISFRDIFYCGKIYIT